MGDTGVSNDSIRRESQNVKGEEYDIGDTVYYGTTKLPLQAPQTNAMILKQYV
ncbi:MAG TPA: hypothetical protein PKD52_02340 [Clostridiales bacterium]|nr:hypothetical protein [Clostridiales bacterium]